MSVDDESSIRDDLTVAKENNFDEQRVEGAKFLIAVTTGIGGGILGGKIGNKVFDKKDEDVGKSNGSEGNATKASELTVRPADSPYYSTVYEIKLPPNTYPNVSRQRHNQLANESLHKQFESDSTFAAKMEVQYPGIVDGVKPGARGAYSRTAPTKDVTWHHAPEKGQLELLPIDHHTSSGAVQNTLHPEGKGGYSDWGKE